MTTLYLEYTQNENMQYENHPTREKKSVKLCRQKFWVVAAALIVSLCIAYLLPATQTAEPIVLSPEKLVAPASNDTIETPITPKQYNTYMVAPDLPRYLSIPKLGKSARVLSVGVDAQGAVGSPASIHNVGWYTRSAKPGQAGVMFMDGHVSGPNQPGVFKQLSQLTSGDTVEVERGDGEKFTYRVKEVRLALENKVNMGSLLVSPDADGQHLVLMTCGGPFNRETDQFSSRVIVSATRT